MRYITTLGDREYLVEIIDEDHVVVDGTLYKINFHSVVDQPVYSLLVDDQSYEAYVYPVDEIWQVLLHGRFFPVQVEDEREKRLRLASGGQVKTGSEFKLKAPMPGLVVSVNVTEGQEVKVGDVLIVLESMKMQNQLKSPKAGFVTRLRARAGDSVEQRQVLLCVV